MGKSTLSKSCADVADVDFGTWRKDKTHGKHFWELTPAESAKLWKEFVSAEVVPALNQGKVVLTNEPGVVRNLPAGIRVDTVLPDKSMQPTWLLNILNRAGPEEVANPDSFSHRLVFEFSKWINSKDWKQGKVHWFKTYDDWNGLLNRTNLEREHDR